MDSRLRKQFTATISLNIRSYGSLPLSHPISLAHPLDRRLISNTSPPCSPQGPERGRMDAAASAIGVVHIAAAVECPLALALSSLRFIKIYNSTIIGTGHKLGTSTYCDYVMME